MRSLLVLFVAVAFFATGETRRCYQCSWPQAGCNDEFEKSTTKEVACATGWDYCSKITSELSNGTIAQARGCGKQELTGMSRASDLYMASQTVNWCNSDLCNGVSATSAALSTMMVLVVPFIYANRH